VVELHDVFEIDNDAFATVLEYCGGTDLDRMLKQHGTLPEREARLIVLQVLAGLRYLNNIGSFRDAGGYDESYSIAAKAKKQKRSLRSGRTEGLSKSTKPKGSKGSKSASGGGTGRSPKLGPQGR